MRAIVALFTRAWIEISPAMASSDTVTVALFTRAWIEMLISSGTSPAVKMSPSSRGRGLKY